MRTILRCLVFANLIYAGIVPAVNPIIVVSIDGLRPDAIEKAEATTLLSLIAEGVSFPNARTVRPSVTLPAHTSMVTGLDPKQHGLWWDDYRADYGPVRHVTALELVNKAGFHTAMIVAKDKLIHLNRPNSMDHFQKTEKEGAAVAEAFDTYVGKNGLPDLSFLHLPDPDAKGHLLIWMSKFYLNGVRDADDALASIISTAKEHSQGKPLTIIVTADHGGFGFGHASDIDANNKIPFIAWGENIPRAVTKREKVRPYDIAPTILRHFNLPIPTQWLGKAAPILATSSDVTMPELANVGEQDARQHEWRHAHNTKPVVIW